MSMYGAVLGLGGFVTAYGPKVMVGIDASESERDPGAVQSFREECDINNIMADVQQVGMASWMMAHAGTFEDVTGLDFQSCMDQIVRAQEAFDDLPAAVRDRFANDPAKFLDFLGSEANREEAVKLGLVNPPNLVPGPGGVLQHAPQSPAAAVGPAPTT